MAPHRYLPLALFVATACAQRPATTATQPLVPKNGPNGSVRAMYEGGIFNRRVTAYFRVERPAYVLVAHLGGDGVLRILFPEDARETGYVPARRLFRTDVANGDHDAAPGFWSIQRHVMRNTGARLDSYDGNGHGFVFMIASAIPLRFDRVSEFGLWDELEFPGYPGLHDPREAVRRFANLVSPSGRYTLDYASSMSSRSLYSYADANMDCSILAGGFGFMPWFAGAGHLTSLFTQGFPACGRNAYYAYGAEWTNATLAYPPVVTTPIVPRVPTITPRPGRRDPLMPDRGGLSRPTFAERATDATNRRGIGAERRQPAGGVERRGIERRGIEVDRRGYFGGERFFPAPATPYRGAFRGPGLAPGTSGSSRPRDPRPSSADGPRGGSPSTPASSPTPASTGTATPATTSAPRAAPGDGRRKP